jgi:hypothetical protein
MARMGEGSEVEVRPSICQAKSVFSRGTGERLKAFRRERLLDYVF